MDALFHTHSGLRYLVLLGVIGIFGYHLFMTADERPYIGLSRRLGAIFLAIFDLQILVGIVLAVGMVRAGRWYPMLWVHAILMLAAAAVAHVLFAKNRRRPLPDHGLPLSGALIAGLLMVAAIFAIGRTPFAMTVIGSHSAAAKSAMALRAAQPGGDVVVAKEIWAARCVACHGHKGSGDGVAAYALSPPPTDFTSALWQGKATNEGIEAIIAQGGAPLNKSSVMPANPDLPPSVIEVLRNFVRSPGTLP